MKAIPLPDGMTVTRKIHVGKLKRFGKLPQPKFQLHLGYINTEEREVDVIVSRDRRNKLVLISIYLDDLNKCSKCGGHINEIQLVMN